jgi:hypothetical protein
MIIVALDTHRRRSPCAIVHPETANNVLTSASPGRAAAMVPAPVEGSELPGHGNNAKFYSTDSGQPLTELFLTREREGRRRDRRWPRGGFFVFVYSLSYRVNWQVAGSADRVASRAP